MSAEQSLEVELPILLPLADRIIDCHRLVYRDVLTVYYSYQSPIAFFSLDKLFTRQEYWERRRPHRKAHIDLILADANSKCPYYMLVDTPNFKTDLGMVMTVCGLIPSAQPSKPQTIYKPALSKRVVRI